MVPVVAFLAIYVCRYRSLWPTGLRDLNRIIGLGVSRGGRDRNRTKWNVLVVADIANVEKGCLGLGPLATTLPSLHDEKMELGFSQSVSRSRDIPFYPITFGFSGGAQFRCSHRRRRGNTSSCWIRPFIVLRRALLTAINLFGCVALGKQFDAGVTYSARRHTIYMPNSQETALPVTRSARAQGAGGRRALLLRRTLVHSS